MLIRGDNINILKELGENSVDAVVTDPPYGLAFMGKKWDYDVPSVELWKEVLRVLKPGGHLLAFFGTRTYHRGVVRIEDAGFEIRDQIQWLYGSGFPKSLDVSKAIDKAAGAEREVIGVSPSARPNHQKGNSGHQRLHNNDNENVTAMLTAPATEDAKRWQGFGTALKPANEPICLARKPLSEKTIVDNVLKWGTGGINIDGCRIGTAEKLSSGRHTTGNQQGPSGYKTTNRTEYEQNAQGRFPANILLDEEAAQMLDEQSGVLRQGGSQRGSTIKPSKGGYGGYAGNIECPAVRIEIDTYGASRFFYVAKASKRERNRGLEGMPEKESGIKNNSGRGFSETDPYRKITNQNHHPTVKPIKLMEYLIKLITPPNGVVLDPFMGSGSTGIAAKNLGFGFIGIELEEEYFEIAKRRIENK